MTDADPNRSMLLYYVTDRRSLEGDLVDRVAEALAAGVDLIQIREKDLLAGKLFDLAQRIRQLPNPRGSRILINERLDVALAAGLDGVHLPASHPPIETLRRASPRPLTIAVSCHSDQEVQTAVGEGADVIVLAPIFKTISKPAYSRPLGIDQLAQTCAASPLPVLALGGVTPHRVAACLQAGAAGVAGISLFQCANDLTSLVQDLHGKPLSSP